MRMTVPPSPRTRPSTFRAERRSLLTRKCARTAVHTGAAAPNTETRAARDELLRPEDDRPAPAEIDEADNDGDGDRSPAPRKRLPQGDGYDREERGDRDRA